MRGDRIKMFDPGSILILEIIMAKKILETQLNYIVNKSNHDRARRELARLKSRPGTSKEDLAAMKARVNVLKQKDLASLEVINLSGESKTTIG